MSSPHSEAEKKFWATPELIEQLLPYLNLQSTMSLAKIHQMTQNVLQGRRVWKKVIQRNCPIVGLDHVKHFVAILKTLKGPEDHILVLLDAICESNTPFKSDSFPHVAAPKVQMSCPRHQEGCHDVSLDGFGLLEEVEGAFGTTQQTVEAIIDSPMRSITAGMCVPFFLSASSFSALGSRMSRQEKEVEFPDICLDIKDIKDAESFKEAMQNIQLQWTVSLLTLSPYCLFVEENLGREGWELVAEGLQLHPGAVTYVETSKEALAGVSKEDLRGIWDALIQDGGFKITHFAEPGQPSEAVKKEDGDVECLACITHGGDCLAPWHAWEEHDAWERLEHIVDVSTEEWKAENKEWLRALRERKRSGGVKVRRLKVKVMRAPELSLWINFKELE